MATILVVDDFAPNREFLAWLLSHAGHQVIEASDGSEALECVLTRSPDLVISDVLMPNMDGVEFARRVRENPSKSALPIAFYTATYRLAEARAVANSCGVTTVLSKPAEPEVILETVARLLASKLGGTDQPHQGTLFDSHPDHADPAEPTTMVAGPTLPELPRIESDVQDQSYAPQGLSLRMAAVMEASLAMAAERDPDRLQDIFCRAAQKVVRRDWALVGFQTGHAVPARVVAVGIEIETAREIAASVANQSVPTDVLTVPLTPFAGRVGWLCAGNIRGGPAFSHEDLDCAQALAAQFTIAYHNRILYRAVHEHSVRLEAEIVSRTRASNRLLRLTRIHEVSSSVNAAIVRIHDRKPLFDEVCRIAVVQGRFKIAWIGLTSPESGRLEPLAWTGICSGDLDPLVAEEERRLKNLEDTTPDEVRIACNDLIRGASMPVPGNAADLGCQTVISLPLLVDGTLIGSMQLLSTEATIADAEERTLLEGVRADLSFALAYICSREKLDRAVYYDALTGLPNTVLLQERLDQCLRSAEHSGAMAGVIALDLDRFRHLNDTLGRGPADTLLKAVATRLIDSLDGIHTVSRIGSDSFALIADSLRRDTDVVTLLAERILPCFSAPFRLDDREVSVTVTAGIAIFPADGTEAVGLLAHAEVALKMARSSDQAFLFYAPEMHARAAELMTLEADLRRAVDRDEFILHYQPKVASSDCRMTGVEALIRWKHPEQGLVPPGRFVPVLEQMGLIEPVGRWIVEQALRDQVRWRGVVTSPPPTAINVSALQLRGNALPIFIRDAASRAGMPPSVLHAEITESVVMKDVAQSALVLQELQALGIKIAIDDFGTGYSSLRYLAELPIDVLKIDRAFVEALAKDAKAKALVSTIVTLAHQYGLKSIAEGVESPDQAEALVRMNCDEMQGYLFSPPITADEIESILCGRKELGAATHRGPEPGAGKEAVAGG